jgi:head-tail adaptor
MLTASDLSFFQGVQNEILPSTLNVISYTETSDGMGGFTSASSSGSAMGRIGGTAGQDGNEQAIAERLGVDKPYFITLPFGTVISEANRITIGSRTFEVVAVTSASYSTAVRCMCREIE